MQNLETVVFLGFFFLKATNAVPAYNYSDRAEYNLSPIEDHSQNLEHIAPAIQQIEKNYHNHLQVCLVIFCFFYVSL